jgi:hypothetical protein
MNFFIAFSPGLSLSMSICEQSNRAWFCDGIAPISWRKRVAPITCSRMSEAKSGATLAAHDPAFHFAPCGLFAA